MVCSLTEGFTIFGVAVAAKGDYDKDFPPVFPGELFVEIRFEELPESTLRNALGAYMFELSSSLGIDLEISPRPSLDDEDRLEERGTPESTMPETRLRPLLFGKGMTELLQRYNRAVATSDLEVQVLYFTKVFEFVSQTVIRLQSTEAIRAKLLNPRSLRPDAEFIAELQTIVEEQRNFQKDREAVKQTAITCCEASELAKVAPPFLQKLKSASSSGKRREKEEALAALGLSLYATRNAVAHAKANYTLTGDLQAKNVQRSNYPSSLSV